MSAVTLPPPAQIRRGAVTDLRGLPKDILLIRPVVETLLQIRTDPKGTGISLDGAPFDVNPLGIEYSYYARCGSTGYVALYTVGDQGEAIVEAVQKVAGL